LPVLREEKRLFYGRRRGCSTGIEEAVLRAEKRLFYGKRRGSSPSCEERLHSVVKGAFIAL
jgi:hypothetical protein